MRGKAFSVVLLILAACGTPACGSILVTASANESRVRYADGSFVNFDFDGTWPAATTNASDGAGLSSSTSTSCLPTSISAVFDHERASPGYSIQECMSGLGVSFTAQSNDTYSIHGAFGGGTHPTTTYLLFRAVLTDLTNFNATLMDSYQFDGGSAGGLTIGGAYNSITGSYLNGSPTGTLVAGHEYHFQLFAMTGAANPEASHGSGGISFFSAVPEPGSLIVWGALGALGLVVTTTRRIARGSQPVENTSTRREQVS